jgi:hypothetical protein
LQLKHLFSAASSARSFSDNKTDSLLWLLDLGLGDSNGTWTIFGGDGQSDRDRFPLGFEKLRRLFAPLWCIPVVEKLGGLLLSPPFQLLALATLLEWLLKLLFFLLSLDCLKSVTPSAISTTSAAANTSPHDVISGFKFECQSSL